MSGLSLFSSGSSSPHGGVGVSTGQEAIDGHLVYASLGTLPDRSTRQEEVIRAIREIIHEHLEDAPLRLLKTHSGILCSRDAQIKAFIESTEYEELLDSLVTHGPLQRPIEEAVMMYFRWVMLSHRWGMNEPMLRDIQHKDIYSLDPVGGTVKLQNFCKAARDAGYRWAWSDTCCIDKQSNYEVQKSVNSMFVWYYHSALTIVYLSDVPPLSKSGALAESAWNMRGWTIPELLAPKVILFYKADWTLYLDDRSYNHKESVAIMRELQHSTGINAQALVAFRPEMRDAREKLQWASSRLTTIQEDIAYSLFGVFGVHLPVIYGERKQNALGRLLQEIIARSGDISALDWVGKPSEFNSCLPADISSYKAPPCVLSPSEDEMQTSVSVSTLRSTVGVEVLKQYTLLYTRLENMHTPRFAHCRLHLPCITFPLTEISWRPGQDGARSFTYSVKADGLKDLLVTEARLSRFPSKSPVPLSFLLVRPWNRYGLGEDWDWSGAGSLSDNDSLSWSPGDNKRLV
ncbi:hypothetical protein BDR07DRAFT_1011962 [Suillus spraguei]|nr:hypothetical protein BDR07DRAFT_1011962 [Suillus spraguei]